MVTDVLKSYSGLQEQLDRAKNNLTSLNDNIRRIVGRDPKDVNLRGDRKRSFNDQRRSEPERQKTRDSSPTPAKRRAPAEPKSVFSRLSAPVRESEAKPRLHSRVIRELPSRQEIVAAQGADEQSRARNRRMFGSLLGTLQKFCQEESRLKQKEEKKAQIEKKLEEQEIQERETLKKERENLFIGRKRQQLEIRELELKMIRLKEFEVWEKSKKDRYNFIRTDAKPHIYYKPKVMNEQTEKVLAACQARLNQEIEKRRSQLNEEIRDIETRFKERAEEIDRDDFKEKPSAKRNFFRNGNYADVHDEDNGKDSICVDHSDEEENISRLKSNITVKCEPSSDNEENSNSLDRTLSSVVVTQIANNDLRIKKTV